jgi:hypothetical protein
MVSCDGSPCFGYGYDYGYGYGYVNGYRYGRAASSNN